MAQRIQIVNKARGPQKALGQMWATEMAKDIEVLARREATKNKFDITKESNGLMRAILHVISRKELILEASRMTRTRLEKEGKIEILKKWRSPFGSFFLDSSSVIVWRTKNGP